MFDISVKGFLNLARRWVDRRGWGAVVGELIQNAADEASTLIRITTTAIAGKPFVEVRVEDDNPDGFKDLRDAYTLFTDSRKVTDATKAGRFNAGEKFVVALAQEAKITTTTGSVRFDRTSGKRRSGRDKTETGSVFEGLFKISREELADVDRYIASILMPERLTVTLNGRAIPSRDPIATFEATLDTEIAEAVGEPLRRSKRKATVEVFDTLPGETASLYELGLPVVETGDKWHVNVLQKVPLTIERDNVPPSYLRTLRTLVANQMAALIEPEDAGATWVNEALADDRIEPLAARRIMNIKFGEKRVSRDPGDPESAAKAFSEGYRVVESRDLTPNQRTNAKKHGLIESSSKMFPTPKLGSSPDGEPAIPEESWTPTMLAIADYAKALAQRLLRAAITVSFYENLGSVTAAYGRADKALTLTKRVAEFSAVELDALLIHELAHDLAENHLSRQFFDECCRLGAELRQLAVADPGFFKNFEQSIAKS